MSILLTKLGFHHTFPRSIVFAPLHLGGLGITPFNVIIAQRKIQFLYRHLRASTDIGKVILINLQWAQIQAGRVNPIFTSDDRIDYIENTWVTHLHNELQAMTGKLLITQLHSGTYQRTNDKYLMDAWDEEGLPTALLQILNYCRIYLKVTRLSDIATNDGKHIQAVYLHGTQINRITTHDWPRQQKPSNKAWKLWHKHLKQTFYRGTKLKQPLGKWQSIHSEYNTVCIPDLNLIQKTTIHGTFTSNVIRTRTKVSSCLNWTRQQGKH